MFKMFFIYLFFTHIKDLIQSLVLLKNKKVCEIFILLSEKNIRLPLHGKGVIL